MRILALVPGTGDRRPDHGSRAPEPENTDENRRRFLELDAALKPAFLAKDATPASMRNYLGYFYRERS